MNGQCLRPGGDDDAYQDDRGPCSRWLLTLAVVGAAWQAIASRRDRRRFPPRANWSTWAATGLHLIVSGGAGRRAHRHPRSRAWLMSADWAWVHAHIAQNGAASSPTIGPGWLERHRSRSRDAATSAEELHTHSGWPHRPAVRAGRALIRWAGRPDVHRPVSRRGGRHGAGRLVAPRSVGEHSGLPRRTHRRDGQPGDGWSRPLRGAAPVPRRTALHRRPARPEYAQMRAYLARPPGMVSPAPTGCAPGNGSRATR